MDTQFDFRDYKTNAANNVPIDIIENPAEIIKAISDAPRISSCTKICNFFNKIPANLKNKFLKLLNWQPKKVTIQ